MGACKPLLLRDSGLGQENICPHMDLSRLGFCVRCLEILFLKRQLKIIDNIRKVPTLLIIYSLWMYIRGVRILHVAGGGREIGKTSDVDIRALNFLRRI